MQNETEAFALFPNAEEWANYLNLNPISGFGPFSPTAFSVYDGVQAWVGEDPSTAVGIWGNALEETDECGVKVQWAVYQGDCVDPIAVYDNLEDAEFRASQILREQAR